MKAAAAAAAGAAGSAASRGDEAAGRYAWWAAWRAAAGRGISCVGVLASGGQVQPAAQQGFLSRPAIGKLASRGRATGFGPLPLEGRRGGLGLGRGGHSSMTSDWEVCVLGLVALDDANTHVSMRASGEPPAAGSSTQQEQAAGGAAPPSTAAAAAAGSLATAAVELASGSSSPNSTGGQLRPGGAAGATAGTAGLAVPLAPAEPPEQGSSSPWGAGAPIH
jgi:hypothetical protein